MRKFEITMASGTREKPTDKVQHVIHAKTPEDALNKAMKAQPSKFMLHIAEARA